MNDSASKPTNDRDGQDLYCPECKHCTSAKAGVLIVKCEKCGYTVPNPFVGEMECVVCGAKTVAEVDTRTQWRAVNIPIGGRREVTIYACPKEFPANGAGQDNFAKAYLRMFRAAEKKLGVKLLKPSCKL